MDVKVIALGGALLFSAATYTGCKSEAEKIEEAQTRIQIENLKTSAKYADYRTYCLTVGAIQRNPLNYKQELAIWQYTDSIAKDIKNQCEEIAKETRGDIIAENRKLSLYTNDRFTTDSAAIYTRIKNLLKH